MNQRSMYDQREDDELSLLHSKVAQLKNITIEIGEEAKKQNKFLDTLRNQFEGTGGLLSKTMKKVEKLTTSGGGKYLCWVILFAFFVIFLSYVFFF